ncbi:MAG TPA: NAD-dependent protein deacylase [Mobilitalea sp.]|nr:NAD-dependent protein deacylase [Mobilitalea sp.]
MTWDKIVTLQKWIADSNNIVFFGGAGVSTESGIPDFRGTDGIYHMKYKYPPEVILSHTFFMDKTKEFYEFYRDKMIYEGAEPNITHKKLAQLEQQGKLNAVITQNIDGLHQKAGSRNILELHGSVLRNYCMTCHTFYSLADIIKGEDVPHCTCGGLIKPDVVLYEESLDEQIHIDAIRIIARADLLIVGGTSLSVYPAAELIRYYRGNKLVIINKSPTPYDKESNLLIQAGLGEVFDTI